MLAQSVAPARALSMLGEQNAARVAYHGLMLLVAMSCLQGRPMRAAFAELRPLADGVQLTPGNLPTPSFADETRASAVTLRTHHGFSFTQRAREVWRADGSCAATSDSVHPPRAEHAAAPGFLARLPSLPPEIVLETMYPGYCLGDDASLLAAMALGRALAVDVSHVHIARAAGTLAPSTWARLQDYARVVEVHLSANDGRADTHRPLTRDTFGLDWARARARAGTPLVVECYLHRLSPDERRRQIDHARG